MTPIEFIKTVLQPVIIQEKEGLVLTDTEDTFVFYSPKKGLPTPEEYEKNAYATFKPRSVYTLTYNEPNHEIKYMFPDMPIVEDGLCKYSCGNILNVDKAIEHFSKEFNIPRQRFFDRLENLNFGAKLEGLEQYNGKGDCCIVF